MGIRFRAQIYQTLQRNDGIADAINLKVQDIYRPISARKHGEIGAEHCASTVLASDTFGRVEVGGEERADTGELVGSPVLQESCGFGGDVPL